MCGIAGCVDLLGRGRVEEDHLRAMTERLFHRGPDSSGYLVEPNVGLGVRRLSIIDLETGDQPIYNEDRSVAVVCNGEILNFQELRQILLAKGHAFRSRSDVEVLVHLYEEVQDGLVEQLNGQFAFALYDRRRGRLLLARDHFGVSPLYYVCADGMLVFGSEIKALLEHPRVERRLDLVGLDQLLSLPGLVSPRTAFAGIESLESGHLLRVEGGEVRRSEYWDLLYPQADAEQDGAPEEFYVEGLREALQRSVRRRLQADVPVGVFLSGGLDSSLVAAMTAAAPVEDPRHSFSVTFEDCGIDEGPFQRLAASRLGFRHHEVPMSSEQIAARLREMVFHAECPVKESFDTCSLALSAAARGAGVPVVLAGEGADELFGGYPGYRFDAMGVRLGQGLEGVEGALEEELREELWGDRELFYERDQVPFRELKRALYSPGIRELADEIDFAHHPLINRERLRGRHPLHQRSYLDFKLRLADHLLLEHGDRMVLANSVEARYPFLDIEVVGLATRMPPRLKVNDLTEKYVLRRLAAGLVPARIIRREKFGFRAPGSPFLLQRRFDWVEELLSSERTRRVGVFDEGFVERLKQRYSARGFQLHPHLETDLLMVVLTLHLLCELFRIQTPT